MAQPLLDPTFFAQVFLDCGAPTWPNGYDIAPWALHEDMQREGQLRRTEPVWKRWSSHPQQNLADVF